jgi:diguanylate cyclase (GGDEF)-like protein
MGTLSPERLQAVIELQNAIAAAGMNADEVMGIVVERACALTGATWCVVALVEGEEIAYRAVSRPSTIAVGTRLSRTTSVPGRCTAERSPIRIDDTSSDDRMDADARMRLGAGSLLCVPLLYGESAVGVLEVGSVRPKAFGDEDVETLRLLAQIIAIALHRAYTYPRPRYDSATDALTGLGNKRAFDERIQAELTRNRRYGHSFSLAIIDLNGVEAAVDRVGQAAGDDALREIARILQKHTRAIDAGFRVAADDFAIVMPGTSLEGARIVAERCRAHIHDAKLCDGGVTTSIGVVEAADETAEDLAGRAAAAVAADKAAHR